MLRSGVLAPLAPRRRINLLLVPTILFGCSAPEKPRAMTPDLDASGSPRDAEPGDVGTEEHEPPEGGGTEVGTEAGDCDHCSPDELCVDHRCKSRGALVAPTFAACASPPCINVFNACAIPLWVHAVGSVPIDDGIVRKLAPGEEWQYASLPELGGGRLYAYYQEPPVKQDKTRLVSDYNQFVEMTIDKDAATGAWAQNYNVSYVDYTSLPVFMKATGATCQDTKCGARFDDWLTKLAECPTDLRNTSQGIGTCTGSFGYCVTPDGPATYDTTRPYCTKMMQAHGFSGSAIYGGYFPDHPATEVAFWDGVAAWNRGTVAGDADDGHYYTTEPYNEYARWIHRGLGCSNVYAFSTDDHQDKAGFVRCVAPELDVVWCPYR
jgi:hypothetical protein